MISFDSLTLKAFTEENKDFLTGSRIQKIQQPTRRDFILQIRKNGETAKLYININPQFHHICLMNKDNELKRRIEIPPKPPMFCMLLRKHLENAVISKVNQPENERIVEFYIETYNELNEKIYLCLTIELMGKHSNVILYNSDTGIILGCAHNVGAEKSREREVAGTLPYIYPPKQRKTNIKEHSGNINYNTLSKDFYLFSDYFAKLCKGKPLNTLIKYTELTDIMPAVSADYSEYSELLTNECVPQKNVNEMIDNYYAHHQEKLKFEQLKSHLQTLTAQKLKRTRNSLTKINTQLTKENDAEKFRQWADLIMANLYTGKDFLTEIEVFDWYNNQQIKIPLDNSKTLKDNANKYYKLYNKSKTSKEKLNELKEELSNLYSYFEQIAYSLNIAADYEDLAEIKPELITEENNKESKKKASCKAIEPEKITKKEYTIYIGKNNRQNDYIVSKLSKDDDLWFHTKDCAGSHVLLKGENPPENLILECAQLAKKYSSGSNSSKIGVIYTKRKYLRKPPKANLGYVTYRNEKEIIID